MMFGMGGQAGNDPLVFELQRKIRELQEQLSSAGANRYWEGRWRDEKAENERLRELTLAWAHVPKRYEGRWCFDYKEESGEGWFFVYCNGFEILRCEDSEVADAVCRAHNAGGKSVESYSEEQKKLWDQW